MSHLTFLGGQFGPSKKNPSLTHRWLKRVVDLYALDQGLRVFSYPSSLYFQKEQEGQTHLMMKITGLVFECERKENRGKV